MKTRRHIFGGLMLAAAALVCLTGCKKDDEGEKITLGVDFEQTAGMQKTYIGNEDKTIYWSTDDNVQVNGKNYLVHDGVVEVELSDDGYAAVYPKTGMLNGTAKNCTGGTVVIPATQEYTEKDGHQVLGGPMAARLDSKTGRLLFRNLYAVIKVTVQAGSTDFNLSSITVESTNGVNLAGTQPFTFSGSTTTDVNNISLGDLTDVSTGVTLNFNESIAIPQGETKDFYLYTVPFSGANLTVKINENMIDNPTTARNDVSISRSQLRGTTVDVKNLTVPFGSIGRFSVGNGKYVTFSPGNLRYDYTAGKFYFADHQYDVVGADNATHLNGVVDLFQLGQQPMTVEGCEDGKLHPLARPANLSAENTKVYDWGNVCKIYHSSQFSEEAFEAPGTGWYTLTVSEMDYLLNTRDNHDALSGISSIEGINGVVLLPDGWDGAIKNSYTLSEWAAMEAAGAVFLPAVNHLHDGTYNGEVHNKYAVYWLAEPHSETHQKAFYLNVNTEDIGIGAEACKDYAAVRLVKQID